MAQKKNNEIFDIGDVFYEENRNSHTSVDDLLLFSKHESEQEAGSYARYLGARLSARRSIVFVAVLGILFVTLLGKIAHIQVVQGKAYAVRALQNRERVVPIPAERGLLFDRYGVQLTKNVPSFTLTIRPQDLPRSTDAQESEERERVIQTLAQVTGTTEEDIRAALSEYGSYSYESIAIQEDLDYERALEVEIAAAQLPGVAIRRGSKRLYVDPSDQQSALTTSSYSLSHVLGYLGKLTREELDEHYDEGYLPTDSIGKSGIEKAYESTLRGVHGRKRIEVDARGREQVILSEEAPSPGHHVTLTLDAEMQREIERIMHTYLTEHQKQRAAAIALDPNTGEVHALVSLPAFNNNDFSGGIGQEQYQAYISNPDRPLFNRAIGGLYPSGSSIKPVVAAAALAEGIITPQTSFLSTGGVRVGQWFFPDWRSGGHGRTDVRKSLADSVNTFYYYIGGGYDDFVGLGIDRISEYLRRFGFGEPLGIAIPGEAAGFIPSKKWKEEVKQERWYVGDTYNVSIGQGDLLVTPLQIAAMTGAVANGGTLHRPQLVKEFTNPLTREKKTLSPEVINEQVTDRNAIETVRLGMRDCVTYGSCIRLSRLPISAAGKTGTAQWSNTKDPHGWFTSFAPLENPQIVFTVLVEEGIGGATTAAPIAEAFYEWWVENRYRS